MSSIQVDSNRRLKCGVLLFLCVTSGWTLKSRAQDGRYQAFSEAVSTNLPDVPSSLEPFQTQVEQSTSQLPATAHTSSNPNYRSWKDREKLYLDDLIGPGAFIGSAIQAGVDQGRTLKVSYPPDGFVGPGNHPAHGAVPEWGEGFDGYAKRYASRFGENLTGVTIKYGVGELLREDVTYHRCDCTGFFPRVSHAFVSSLVAHTKSGRAVPSLPALVSPFLASEIAVKAWYSARYNASDALRASSNVYYTLPLKNLLYEFRKR